jgi:hypothetical protein
MLECLNSWWVFIICAILFFFICKKTYNLFRPFDEYRFIEQQKNQEKLKKKLSSFDITSAIPKLTSYYVGV